MQITANIAEKLELTNDGALSIYFIGTGSAFAKTLNQNNIFIVKGEDCVLVDCGTKCSQALFEVGLSLSEIENFLITHSHADHVGGLEEAMMFGRYLTRSKPNMIITEEYQHILWERSLRGGSAASESNKGKELQFEDFWNVIRPCRVDSFPRETWQVNIGSINIKMPRTKHIPVDAMSWEDSFWSCGVILDDRIFYTSDTRYDLELIMDFDARLNLEYIFHDCQMFTGGVHASLDELCQLPKEIRAKTVLMHYGDNWKEFIPKAKKAGFHSWAQQNHFYTFD